MRRSAELGTPVVVKVLHPDVLHKTDAGGVHLGIADEGALDRALDAIDRIAGARYLLEETAPPGRELILGARRDPVFGPLVALGTGGIDVEAAGDVAVRLAPLTHGRGRLDARRGRRRRRGRVRGADRRARRHRRGRGEPVPGHGRTGSIALDALVVPA